MEIICLVAPRMEITLWMALEPWTSDLGLLLRHGNQMLDAPGKMDLTLLMALQHEDPMLARPLVMDIRFGMAPKS